MRTIESSSVVGGAEEVETKQERRGMAGATGGRSTKVHAEINRES